MKYSIMAENPFKNNVNKCLSDGQIVHQVDTTDTSNTNLAPLCTLGTYNFIRQLF